ncbi:protein kinase [uncultured Jatrophihabitans sp.]|uniref:serine/threonine-protein kinase n=1 Tax=uncultured Jatrophihabitans sp. TaxID=1610747 RepID=UPI0035CA3D18
MTAAGTLAAALPGIEIGTELGRGGFGIVYGGRHKRLGREVAIKQLPPAFANDEEIRDRFVTEARVLAALDHPHIVPVYDFVEADGLCLLVMESLPGGTVWDVFRKEGMNPGHACVIVVAAAAGLHHAHVNGVLHRDVKPENLLLTANRHLKVTDFGIAKVIGGADAVATSSGDILGTPAYMAPEQAVGGNLTAAADVYAAGVMLYELLSGQLPYSQEGGGLAIVYRHLHEAPIPLQDTAPQVPRQVADVVMRALAREPADRFGTAEEFAVAIGEAAVDGFGGDWYSASGLRVIGSDRVMSTLTSPGLRRGSASTVNSSPATVQQSPNTVQQSPKTVDRSPRTQAGGLFAQGDHDGRETRREPGLPAGEAPPARPDFMSSGAGLPVPAAQAGPPARFDSGEIVSGEIVPAEVIPAPALPSVRPANSEHLVGSIAILAKPQPLVPVRQILDVPRRPALEVALAGVLLVLLLVVTWIGLGTSKDGSGTTTGAVTVAGTDVSGGGDVTADLGSDIPLTISNVPAGVTTARATLTVHGVSIGSSDDATLVRSSSGSSAALKLGSTKYLVGGPVDADLQLRSADKTTVAERHFSLKSSKSGFLTIPGVVLVLAVLFALAYLESLTRPLWKFGKWRVSAALGQGLVGALLGAVLSGLAWVLGRYQLSVATAIVGAVLGALFGIALGVAAARAGTYRRVIRINKRTPVLR